MFYKEEMSVCRKIVRNWHILLAFLQNRVIQL